MPVTISGVKALRKALKDYAPDLGKETTKEIASILKPITKEARGYVPSPAPLSGWVKSPRNKGRYAFDATEVRRGIGYKSTPSKPNPKGFRALASILNKTAAGAIYETAGRKTLGGNFVPRLLMLTDSPAGKGRMIYKAWEHNNGKATAAVVHAIENANKKLEKRANGGI